MASISGVKVFIDPGHNATHAGASYNGLKEHEVILDIDNACNAQLKSYGAMTGMSRTTHNDLSSNYDTDLIERVNKSNEFGASIFVSIHTNSYGTTSPNSLDTFVRTGASSYTKDFAAKVNSTLASRTGMAQRSPAVKELSYKVINTDNKAWAILTEIGFLSNAGDAAKLDKLAERQTAGKAIADGMRSFVTTLPLMI